MEVYMTNYKCPNDSSTLEKQKKPTSNPQKLKSEFEKFFSGIDDLIALLEDYQIPREFFGFEPINKPNFNLPDNITLQGFSNHFAHIKKVPTVKIQFDTLKSDAYKDANSFDENIIMEAQKKDPNLFRFYLNKTKDRLIKKVKSFSKKGVKRKKKEVHKKLQSSPEYAEKYKDYWTKVYDIPI